ncbi:hypothetical protein [Schumannella soli]|uniref:hypothetical protein n=1 Tax=Schumannella soli TaxID=2590779 RepID=UPI00210666E8|nr:hypothetical protein [Schumannella soli]
MPNIIRTIDNPLDGVLPNFTIFGTEFTELWQKLLAGIWGLAIVMAIVFLIVALASMATASANSNPMAYQTGRTQAIWCAIALVLLSALAVIVGGVLAVVG